MLTNSPRIEVLPTHSWQASIEPALQNEAISALEQGKVLFFPELKFTLNAEELNYLLQAKVAPKTKNVNYNFADDMLRGSSEDDDVTQALLKKIMRRYAEVTQNLIASLFPDYVAALEMGRTSLRPVEIKGRVAPSYRKDDTRLHVDAFPASPNQGWRILRVFYNYNPEGKPRVWRLGEPFTQLAQHFFAKLRAPWPGSRSLLEIFGITKGPRTAYDHYMLHLHDGMKYDMDYQNKVDAEIIEFPVQTTWMVFTDCASHAALSGQHVLEQTFYLPVEAMAHPELSPLKILEQLAGRKLI
jgi:3-deoxy-D-manno-oct-2-ulosonic acid (Kdo) hydroxylase